MFREGRILILVITLFYTVQDIPLLSHLVSDQVSHSYRSTGKIIVLCILIFTFLDSRREDKRFFTE
jgi:hypothetical protein